VSNKRALVTGLICVALIGGTVGGLNQLRLQSPMRSILAEDLRNAGIDVSVHYGGYVDMSTLVYDLRNIGNGTSMADVMRVFLSYAAKVKDQDFDRVELAHKGQVKFVLSGADFKTLGREYGEQNPMYTLRTFPEKVRRADGSRAFEQWEGGLLGVLNKQMEDLQQLHHQWYLGDLGIPLPPPEVE